METTAPATPKERLLEAAGELFAEQGFRGTSVRDICGRAGLNIAAVNYYFRDKEHLYTAVMQYAHECALRRFPPDLGLSPESKPQERLAAFIRSVMFRVLDGGRPGWHGKLMAREMADPTKALETLVEQSFRPLETQLSDIVRGCLGPGADDDTVRQCAISISGQCLHYRNGRAVIALLHPQQKLEPADIERLVQHITRFSLGGLRAIAAGFAERAERN